ncbi:MAG: sulfotransferase family protein [Alphaproteobacteria bacterium]|nr:sulfotransferase family protein [Alphaproteobacteria bacterium]
MSKTLYLHIGHYKTGTTALQVFMNRRAPIIGRSALARAGIRYPETERNHCKHSVYAFSVLRAAGVTRQMYGYDRPDAPDKLWKALFDETQAAKEPITLVSSEEFMRIAEFPEAQRILSEIIAGRPQGLDIKVIAYVREPGPHVASWHNQLIKMNFPVPDLETALRHDIERIHYDYAFAFRPWIEMLGAENVTIRRYVRDRDNPAALHQDFFKAFGVDLAADEVPEDNDPNPRMDDRLTELVRVLQNTGLPHGTREAIRRRAKAYLAAQDAVVPPDGPDLDTVRQRAGDGLNWLAQNAGCGAFAADLAQKLPEAPEEEDGANTLLLGFVYSELIQLRQRLNKLDVEAIDERLARLEHLMSETGDQR